jgi:ChrR Cupin-like domain
MLDRIGDEVARVTSIVRYAPHSHSCAHTHGGGEEFLVLDGVFQDEHGDFPAGWYIRSPPTSQHTPGSASGCVIFVKLWQFDPEDRTQVRLDTTGMPFRPAPGRPGVELIPLFRDGREDVRLERWAPNEMIWLDAPGEAEFPGAPKAASRTTRTSSTSRARPLRSACGTRAAGLEFLPTVSRRWQSPRNL